MAIAELDLGGVLVDANQGFYDAVGVPSPPSLPWRAAHLLCWPTFEHLLSTREPPDGVLFDGVLNLGTPGGATTCLRGTVTRRRERLLLVAEHDVHSLRRLNEVMLRMNRELSETERRLLAANERLSQREKLLEELSHTDPLTNLSNRRHFEDRLRMEIDRSSRYGHPLCLVLTDLDRFKSINDRFGHLAGDRVLQGFSAILKEHCRSTDVPVRMGGEEFALLLVESALPQGLRVAERVRDALAMSPLPPLPEPITSSFGVAGLHRGDDPEDLYRRADQALYRAKAEGGNCVQAAPPRHEELG